MYTRNSIWAQVPYPEISRDLNNSIYRHCTMDAILSWADRRKYAFFILQSLVPRDTVVLLDLAAN